MRLPFLTAPALAACATAAPSADVPAAITVSTNEPFLSATVDGDAILVDGVDVARRRVPLVDRGGGGGTRHWTARDAAGEVRVTVRAVPCEDSMSAARFPFSGTLSIDGRSADGCARPAGTPPPRPPEG